MLVEPLSARYSVKSLLAHFVQEMLDAGYPAAWARGLAGAVRSGRLAAFVALASGRPVGLLAWKISGGRAVIPFVTVLQRDASPAVRALLHAALPALCAAGADQIVYQLRQTNPRPYQQAFLQAGFRELCVEKMTLAPSGDVADIRLGAGYTLSPWRAAYLDPVADLFHQLQSDPLEAVLWPDLQTVDGARGLVEMLTQVGESASFVMLWAAEGAAPAIAGYILARRLRSGEGHIGELGVASAHRRRGLGRALVSAALRALAGAPSVWLTVASTNGPARALYHAFGFEAQDAQSVFVWSPLQEDSAMPVVEEERPRLE